MHPEPPHKKPYKKPEIATFEGQRTKRGYEQQVKKIETPKRTFIHRLFVTEKELSTIKTLRENGVSVEDPFEYSPKGDTKHMAYLGAGVQLSEKIPALTPKEKANVVFQLVSNISKMHTLGITHGHLHPENIVINSEGKITLVDFKFAECAEKMPWHSPEQVFGIFHADYFFLLKQTLKELGLNKKQTTLVLFSIIDHYPMSKYNKDLLKQIVFEGIEEAYK